MPSNAQALYDLTSSQYESSAYFYSCWILRPLILKINGIKLKNEWMWLGWWRSSVFRNLTTWRIEETFHTIILADALEQQPTIMVAMIFYTFVSAVDDNGRSPTTNDGSSATAIRRHMFDVLQHIWGYEWHTTASVVAAVLVILWFMIHTRVSRDPWAPEMLNIGGFCQWCNER